MQKRSLSSLLKKKIKNMPKVSVGIAAYNEEANISYILKSFLAQERESYVLKEVLVFCDGSTDGTFRLASAIKDPLLHVFYDPKRLGQQERQNQIMRHSTGDIIVIAEADSLPYDSRGLEELVKPLCSLDRNKEAMIVGDTLEIEPSNFFEKIVFHGSAFKRAIFKNWKNGDNVYYLGGHTIKALTRCLAEKIVWPSGAPEDAYIYFRVKELGAELSMSTGSKFYIRNVTNVSDRLRQVAKFVSGRKALEKYFDPAMIRNEYRIPFAPMIRCFVSQYPRDFFWLTLYFFEILFNRVFTSRVPKFNALYKPYSSSKKLKDVNLESSSL